MQRCGYSRSQSTDLDAFEYDGAWYEQTITFTPGSLGIKCNDWQKGEISALVPGPAQQNGVREGWLIGYIDDEPYTEQRLDKKLRGKYQYEITFFIREDLLDENDRIENESTMSFGRKRNPSASSRTEFGYNSGGSGTSDAILFEFDSAQLGFSVHPDERSMNCFVTSVEDQKLASQGLIPGSQLLTINGSTIQGTKFSTIVDMLTRCERPFTILFENLMVRTQATILNLEEITEDDSSYKNRKLTPPVFRRDSSVVQEMQGISPGYENEEDQDIARTSDGFLYRGLSVTNSGPYAGVDDLNQDALPDVPDRYGTGGYDTDEDSYEQITTLDGRWRIQSNRSLCEIKGDFVYWPASNVPPDEFKAQSDTVEFNLNGIIYKGTICLDTKGVLQIAWDDGDVWVKYDGKKRSVSRNFSDFADTQGGVMMQSPNIQGIESAFDDGGDEEEEAKDQDGGLPSPPENMPTPPVSRYTRRNPRTKSATLMSESEDDRPHRRPETNLSDRHQFFEPEEDSSEERQMSFADRFLPNDDQNFLELETNPDMGTITVRFHNESVNRPICRYNDLIETIESDWGEDIAKLKMFIVIGDDVMTISNSRMYDFALEQMGCSQFLRPEFVMSRISSEKRHPEVFGSVFGSDEEDSAGSIESINELAMRKKKKKKKKKRNSQSRKRVAYSKSNEGSTTDARGNSMGHNHSESETNALILDELIRLEQEEYDRQNLLDSIPPNFNSLNTLPALEEADSEELDGGGEDSIGIAESDNQSIVSELFTEFKQEMKQEVQALKGAIIQSLSRQTDEIHQSTAFACPPFWNEIEDNEKRNILRIVGFGTFCEEHFKTTLEREINLSSSDATQFLQWWFYGEGRTKNMEGRDQAALEKQQKNARKRYKLIEELLLTERHFQDQIQQILSFKRKAMSYLSENDGQLLFSSNLEFVAGLSKDFLKKLEALWKDFDNDTSRLSTCLEDMGKALRSFASYVCNYKKIDRKREQLEQGNERIRELFSGKGGSQSLANLMIVIVQRPSRLLLLVKQIVKLTDHAHPDHVDLVRLEKLYEEKK